ncbi:hypothetical protein NQ117_17910 [Paenibacillus sp. SC116]|uniref:hypothetical protein n=1 Tax=Paenibacillus sp. SC116 TaxID=2968986 RepID=UPI00215AAF52|nr:hypothetical protein [Paenibacillus sp. SC116]MCR8845561.1 hypothetical protein [Paenibacillus sp. SC116]
MLYIYSLSSLLAGLFIVNAIFAYQTKHIDPALWPTVKYQLIVLPLFWLASLAIGYGIKFGYKAIGQLTFVLTASKGIEIVVCIALGYWFMHEVPTWKTWAGLAIVVVGFFISRLK